MSLNTALMFSKAKDEWETPQAFFDTLNAEFDFGLDVAASSENYKCPNFIGPGQFFSVENALVIPWAKVAEERACWMNPPYSSCREFIAKAALEASRGATVVCLVPSRTDTRWWHAHVWDREKHCPKPGVEVRFVKGRLKFGGAKSGAPFPSVVVIFRPLETR